MGKLPSPQKLCPGLLGFEFQVLRFQLLPLTHFLCLRSCNRLVVVQVAAAAAVGSAAVLWGLVDYKSELKFVGALGLLVTLVNKLRQYNSPQVGRWQDMSVADLSCLLWH